ncbi:disco-interacting protein 2 homolog C-like [Macaca nemestrina]|uniref:disco-interacting protein 2 homolog C-like n=1 Tax=Macaca nemestrina TaxID=9545 RepID=UPI0039B866B5
MLAGIVTFQMDVHTEAVQAALARHKEQKMAVPMPSKRRSLVVQTSMDAYTPPGHKVSHNHSTLPSAMGDSKCVWLCTQKTLFTRTTDQIWCTDLPTPDLNY